MSSQRKSTQIGSGVSGGSLSGPWRVWSVTM